MSKFYKLAIFFSALVIVFTVGNFVFAQVVPGKAYFLEKGKEFYIFDNLYINGYLTVGQDNLDKIGNFGDVLVSKEFYMDSTASLVFCQDERQSGSNAPLNKDCINKVLVWSANTNQGLVAKNQLFTRIKTDKIKATLITLQSNATAGSPAVTTKGGTKIINGCFSNYDSSCNNGELKAATIYLKRLTYLETATGGGFIKVSGPSIKLGVVNLGAPDKYTRHYLCWEGGGDLSGGCHPNGAYKSATFLEKDVDTNSDGIPAAETVKQGSLTGIGGHALCCQILPTF